MGSEHDGLSKCPQGVVICGLVGQRQVLRLTASPRRLREVAHNVAFGLPLNNLHQIQTRKPGAVQLGWVSKI